MIHIGSNSDNWRYADKPLDYCFEFIAKQGIQYTELEAVGGTEFFEGLGWECIDFIRRGIIFAGQLGVGHRAIPRCASRTSAWTGRAPRRSCVAGSGFRPGRASLL